jgi:peptide/nickel transport system ATP-binding protein
VLDRLDFTLREGEIVTMLGKSGAGKSTFLRILAGLIAPSEGQVEYRGRPVTGPVTGLAMVFQSSALFPWLSVLGNVELGLEAQGVPAAERRRRAVDAIDLIGLDGFENAYPKELSGGMRQRVGIMLALVLNAHLVVLDEPTTALDMITQSTILRIIREVHAERGLTTLVITHDIGVVAEVADRLVVMYGGRLVEQGPTREVLGAPRHPYTRGLIKAIPRLTGDIAEAQALPGRPPTLTTVPERGCVFRDRCPLRMDVCDTVDPEAVSVPGARGSRVVACHAVTVKEHA